MYIYFRFSSAEVWRVKKETITDNAAECGYLIKYDDDLIDWMQGNMYWDELDAEYVCRDPEVTDYEREFCNAEIVDGDDYEDQIEY